MRQPGSLRWRLASPLDAIAPATVSPTSVSIRVTRDPAKLTVQPARCEGPPPYPTEKPAPKLRVQRRHGPGARRGPRSRSTTAVSRSPRLTSPIPRSMWTVPSAAVLGSNPAHAPACCSWPPVHTENVECSGLPFQLPALETVGAPAGQEWSGPGKL